MRFEPFRLNDRVLPGQKNDLNVVARLDEGLHEIEDKAPPERPRSPVAVTESVKAYQQKRGLKVDGVVGPGLDPDKGQDRTEGPTLLALNADLRAKRLSNLAKSPRPANRVLPIGTGVGPAQPNKSEDIAKAHQSFALIGVMPKRSAIHSKGNSQSADDLTKAVRTFQAQHGLKIDGIMKPGGETQAKAGPLVEAKVAAEIGEDLMHPQPFEPKPHPTIVRTYPDTPTRMSVPFGSGMGVDNDDTDHRLAVAVADDIVKADGRAEREALEAKMGWPTRVAKVKEPAEPDAGNDAASSQEDDKALRQRLSRAGPDLTKVQIDKAVELARSGDFEGPDGSLQQLAEHVAERYPDFDTPLRAALDAGELSLARLEDQIERHARLAMRNPGDPQARARLEADTNVLVAAYEKQAAQQGIDFDADAARQAAAGLIDAAQGGDQRRAITAAVGLALELAPITGEVAGVIDLVRTYQQLQEAEESGDAERIHALRGAVATAVLGAVPGVGRLVRGQRLVDRARGQLSQPKSEHLSISATTQQGAIERARRFRPVRAVDQQVNLRRWAKLVAREQKAGKPLSLREMAKNSEILQGLSKKELASLQGSISQRIGEEGEIFLRAIMRRGKLAEFKDGLQTQGTTYQYSGQSRRIYDAIAPADAKAFAKGLLMRAESRGENKAQAIESKVATSSHTKKQRETDDRLADPNDSAPEVLTQTRGRGRDAVELRKGPDLDDFQLLRMPVTDIPKQQVMNALTDVLSKKGVKDDVIEAVLQGVNDFYGTDKRLRQKIAIGSVLTAGLVTAGVLTLDEGEPKD